MAINIFVSNFLYSFYKIGVCPMGHKDAISQLFHCHKSNLLLKMKFCCHFQALWRGYIAMYTLRCETMGSLCQLEQVNTRLDTLTRNLYTKIL